MVLVGERFVLHAYLMVLGGLEVGVCVCDIAARKKWAEHGFACMVVIGRSMWVCAYAIVICTVIIVSFLLFLLQI